MRNFCNGLCLLALILFSSHLAAAANSPSLSGTTIPSATQIVDSSLNTWTLSGGEAYENGKVTPSSGVILLLCYGGSVFQENIHHIWWVWDLNTSTWAASSDPRITSPGGTTIPTATQIIDSALNVWTMSGGQAYEKGKLTPSSGVILLLYAKGYVYQENIHHDWWVWRTGAWVATSAPPPASASGTTIPTATQIVDSGTNLWTVSGGQVYENHALTPSSEVTLLLFYGGNVYQENVHHNWWEWNGKAWIATASDPRVGQPLAYVSSFATGGKYSVTVIDTGTNRVTHTIPIGFEASYMVVTPDAKHVYVAGASNTTYGSVAVIDTAQESVVTTIRVPYEPQGIVASPDGTRVYVISAAYVSNPNYYTSSTISTIDTATNAVVATITRPEFDSGISLSPDGKTLYVSAAVPCGCASGQNGAYIDVIDTANSVVRQFFIPSISGSAQEVIYNVVISPDNAKLYSNHSYYYQSYIDEVAVLNPTTGAETTKIPAVLDVAVFSPDSQHLYGVGLGGVGFIDTATDVSTTAVANIPGASDLAITPDGKHLYITDVTTGSVLVADTATYTISTILPIAVAGNGAIAIVSAD
jgi:DNA-binding beta-propeller fold protein YncE